MAHKYWPQTRNIRLTEPLNPQAGAVGVPTPVFTRWQILGGVVWSLGITLAGFALGSRISNVDHYLLPIIAIIIAISFVPIAVEMLRNRRRHQSADEHPDPQT